MKYRFSWEDQNKFVKLSGDANPLHTDPVAARRLIFGKPVVHGVHMLLWALNLSLGDIKSPIKLVKIKTVFQGSLGVDEEVDCLFTHNGEKICIKLMSGRTRVALIDVVLCPVQGEFPEVLNNYYPEEVKCRTFSPDQIQGVSGNFELHLNKKTALDLFPHLTRLLPALQVAEILATTRLVGMECPGMNSIFSELVLNFKKDVKKLQTLRYKVSDCDLRFSLVSIEVNAPGMEGVIKAFIRPDPITQDNFVDLRKLVQENEFSGQKAIIIGGSRGLGEVTAKLLAAGGAEVVMTYYRGEDEAQKIVDDIRANGETASCVSLDISSLPEDDNLGLLWKDFLPDSLYFFPSPFIFAADKGKFSIELFDKFCDFYIKGFLRIFQPLLATGKLKKIFYPSSIAIDELPQNMGEYAAAKIAGETLCDFLEKTNKGIKILKPRLPRMATDQTVSLLPVANNDPAPILLKEIRCLRDL